MTKGWANREAACAPEATVGPGRLGGVTWDVLALMPPAQAKSPSEIPGDYQPPGFGSREAVLAVLASRHVVAVKDDSPWIVVKGIDAAVEIRIVENEGEVTQMTFCVHAGPAGPSFVLSTCRELGLQAIDLQTGEFLDAKGGEANYRAWLVLSGRG
jgi:hypothetical protein